MKFLTRARVQQLEFQLVYLYTILAVQPGVNCLMNSQGLPYRVIVKSK